MEDALLQTHDLAVGYTMGRRTKLTVAEHIGVSMRAGELVCLIGPNGAGKSTLMRTIAGMQKPLAGHITLMGDEIHGLNAATLARRLSVVLTEPINAGLMSGYALVALGRHPYTDWSGRLNPRDEAMVHWAVQAVGAEALAQRPVSELSDGERQKIMIARALAQEPALMILDEPTAFLDLPRRVEIMRLLKQITRSTQRAVLLSTHDLDLALRTADRIWLMPPGGPIETGAPEDLVLSGAFEAVFGGEGVAFDPWSGSFKVSAGHSAVIALAGDGLPAVWTRRALEREGFAVTSNGAPRLARIEINGDDQPRWRLEHPDANHTFESLDDLVGALNRLRSDHHEVAR